MNYYDVLKVSPQASRAEIKSAYRRLARKLHPDRNNGSEDTARKFAMIAEAYEVLGNPNERTRYDRKILEVQFNGNGVGDSLFTSSNPHARRWRRMVYEKRYNDIIDRMIEEERREALAFQRLVYPIVALFVTAVLSTALRPKIFIDAGVVGRIVLITLFVIGVIHVVGRLRDGFIRYTESDDRIHDSILEASSDRSNLYSRVATAGVFIGGLLLCLIIGHLIGTQLDFASEALPSMFSTGFEPEFFLYPPIVALFVDMMHSFALSLDK